MDDQWRRLGSEILQNNFISTWTTSEMKQEGQHPLTGQRATNFRLLANQ